MINDDLNNFTTTFTNWPGNDRVIRELIEGDNNVRERLQGMDKKRLVELLMEVYEKVRHA